MAERLDETGSEKLRRLSKQLKSDAQKTGNPRLQVLADHVDKTVISAMDELDFHARAHYEAYLERHPERKAPPWPKLSPKAKERWAKRYMKAWKKQRKKQPSSGPSPWAKAASSI